MPKLEVTPVLLTRPTVDITAVKRILIKANAVLNQCLSTMYSEILFKEILSYKTI